MSKVLDLTHIYHKNDEKYCLCPVVCDNCATVAARKS